MQRWRSHLIVAVLAVITGFLARPVFPPRGAQLPLPGEGATVIPATGWEAGSEAVIDAVDQLPRTPGMLLDSARADLTGDGVGERIELFAEVERDARGRLMWDDGQRWMLVVHRGSRQYPVIDRFVQLGHVRFWAIEQSGEGPSLLVQVATGSGLVLEAFGYDPARDVFVMRQQFRSSGNVVHVTPHTAF